MTLQGTFAELMDATLACDTDDVVYHLGTPRSNPATNASLPMGGNINTSMARFARRRKCLMAPVCLGPSPRCKKLHSIRTMEDAKKNKEQPRDVLERLRTAEELPPLLDEHIGLCREFVGINWGVLADTFTSKSLTPTLQQLADNPGLSGMKNGIALLRLFCFRFDGS